MSRKRRMTPFDWGKQFPSFRNLPKRPPTAEAFCVMGRRFSRRTRDLWNELPNEENT